MLQSIYASGRTPQAQLSPGESRGQSGDSSFSSLLREAIHSVNDLQLRADQAAQALALGEIDDIHTVTIATAKADVALQLTLQVRNRVVDAYQEIMRMQV